MFFRKFFAFLMTATLLLGMVPVLTFHAAAEGTTHTVINLDDSGPGSLRNAIDSAASGETIVFQSGLTGTITLSSQLTIGKNLTISGPGASSLTISGNNTCRVFAVTGGNVTISALTIADGKAVGASGGNGENGYGGGGGGGGGAAGGGGGLLYIGSDTLVLTGVNFTGNSACGGNGGNGGNGYQAGSAGARGGDGGASDLYTTTTAGVGNDDGGNQSRYIDATNYSGGGGGWGANDETKTSLTRGGAGACGDPTASDFLYGTSNTTGNDSSASNGTRGGNGGTGGSCYWGNGTYAYGGNGGNGGDGYGGAICMTTPGNLMISGCTFTGNTATGGQGGWGGTSNHADPEGKSYHGFGGCGGSGRGGAVYVGSYVASQTNILLINSTFSGNSVAAGEGGLGYTSGYYGPDGGTLAANICSYGRNSISVRNVTGVTSYDGTSNVMLYEAYNADGNASALDASVYELTADGISTSTLTVNLCDYRHFPVFGEMVTLNQGSGHSVISPATAFTDLNGNAVFTVTNAIAETVTYQAVTGGGVTVTETAPIKFKTGGVSAAKSTVAANPTVVTADGTAYSTVTVSLKDATGNAIGSNRTIKLTGTGSSVITPASAVTDESGTVTFTVRDSTTETVTYTAEDVTDGVTLIQTPTINFTEYNWIVSTLDDANTPGTLRYAIANAPANTTITFDGSLKGGTINLTSPLPAINKNLVIEGGNLGITVNGGGQYRVFLVTGGTVSINNLTVANGKSAGADGANGKTGDSSTHGGGISGDSGGAGGGGGLTISGGTVHVDHVAFNGNQAVGGKGGNGGDSMGSGYSYSGWAGIGGNGSNGAGGAVCLTGGALTVSSCTFTGNGASGGGGGNGGNGKDLDGAGGNGGSGLGGAIYASAGTVTIESTTFSGNATAGGSGGSCGSGTTASHGYFGWSGNGGKGGDGIGGAVYITGCTLTITDSQFSGDAITAGSKGTGTSSAYNSDGATAHCDGTAGTAQGTDICSISGTVIPTNVTLSPGSNSFYNSSASNAGASAMTASSSSVISDGTATATITVTLKGAGGSSIGSGKTVTLGQGSGHSVISPSSAVTDSSGTVTFTVKSSRAETVTYTATDVTDGITVGQTASVEFLPPDDAQSAIEASSDSVTADNTEVSTITVTLKYVNGDPAVGKSVSLDQGTGHSSISPASAVTDGSGKAVFTVKSIVAETVTCRAKITPDNVTMAGSVSVTFNAYGWVVNTAKDTGASGSLRYAMSNAPVGSTITFSSALAGETLTLTSALPVINRDITIDGLDLGVTVSGDGKYRVFEIAGGTVTIKNLTVANGKTVGASAADSTPFTDGSGGAIGMGGGLYMTGGTVTLSGMTFDENSVTGGNGGNGAAGSARNGGGGANGCGGAIYLYTGSLTVLDSSFTHNTATGGAGGNGGTYSADNGGNGGNGGSGCGGAIYAYAGSITISNSSFNGNTANFGLGGSKGHWTKQDGSNGGGYGSDIYNRAGIITIDDNVTLAPGTNSYVEYAYAPDAGLSTVTADHTSVMSGYGIYATITVTLIGPGGSSVGAGKTVTLTPNASNSGISPASAVTDGHGRATFTVSDLYAQNVTYTAKDTSDNVTVSQTVTICFMPPDAAKSTVTVDSTQVSSDGVTHATVSVALKGADGSPAGSGKAMTLSAAGGSSVITPVGGGLTDATGTATFRVKDLMTETVVYTARDTSGNVTLSQTVSVQFLPPDKDASAAVTDEASVKADGTTYATISVTLKSAAGTLFGGGKTVTLTPNGGSSTITAVNNGITDSSGTATFRVSDLVTEPVTYTATDTTDGVILTQKVTVTFIQNDWIVTRLDDTDTLGSLRYAVKNAPAGTTISFDDDLKNGTIVLSSPLPVITKKLTIDGSGTVITISGGDTFRVFEVNGGTVTFKNLTIAGGKTAGNPGADSYTGNGGAGADGTGGGLLIAGGAVTIDHVTFRGNNALGGTGGKCTHPDNNTTGGTGGAGYGGAVCLNAGTLTISNSVFTDNDAAGGTGGYSSYGNGGSGGAGGGGAIYVGTGALTMSDTQFSGNSIAGGIGGLAFFTPFKQQGPTGGAFGDDLYNENGTVALSNVTFGALTNSYCTMKPASASTSTVSGSVTSLPADGATPLNVTVTLKDADGKTVGSGKKVTLTASGTPVITSVSNGLTDNNGTVIFTIVDIKSETVTLDAKDTTDNVSIGQVTVTFLPPDIHQSSVITKEASVPANGTAKATITVMIKFGNGIPAAGKTVALTAGSSLITPKDNGKTDENGTATFYVTNLTEGTVTYTATDTSDQLTIGTVDVTFIPYDWVVNTLEDNGNLGTLRYALTNAPGGSIITFQRGLTGTIKLNSTLPAIARDLTIDGGDANVTVSGNNQFRAFWIDSGTVSLKNFAIADCQLVGSVGLSSNWNWTAGGTGGYIEGGAMIVYNAAVSLSHITFRNNCATGGQGGTPGAASPGGEGGYGYGGAIYFKYGTLTISDCTFSDNFAIGGQGGEGLSGGKGGNGFGGAILAFSGDISISNSVFSGNAVTSGVGGPSIGGSAEGGPGYAHGSDIYCKYSAITMNNVTFSPGSNCFYNEAPADHYYSQIGTDKPAVPADGATSATVTVSLKVINGTSAGSGKTVTLTPNNGSAVIIKPVNGGLTDGFGKASFTVTDAADEIVTFTAATDNVTLLSTVKVSFDPYFTVTFDKLDETPVVNAHVAANTIIPATSAPIRANYTFGGWFTDEDCTDGNEWDMANGTVTANMTLYAKWTANPYTVTFNSQGGSSVPSVTAGYHTLIKTPAAPKRTGYQFGGWFKDAECTDEWKFGSDVVAGNITLYAKWTAEVYTIVFDSKGGSAVSSVTAAYNTTLTAPTDPKYSGYTFGGWYKESTCANLWSFANDRVTSETTLYAKWTPDIGSGGSGSGNGNSEKEVPKIEVITSGGTTTATASVQGAAGAGGTVSVSLTGEQVSGAAGEALKEASKQGTRAEVEISVTAAGSASGVSVTVPQSALRSLSDSGIDVLTITSPAVTVRFDETALAFISTAGSGSLTISAAAVNNAALSGDDRALIGDRPVYNLTVTSGNTAISDFGGGEAEVSIPYTPRTGEDISKIIVYYVSGGGQLITVPKCIYDPSTGLVTFKTKHFSAYAIGYNDVHFTDVSGWYADAVYYLAARNIMAGPGHGQFNPGGSITRAELVQLLYNLSGSPAGIREASPFSDVKTTDWYFDAVMWAYGSGIITGYAGKFTPNAPIKRQDMAVMIMRYVDKAATHSLQGLNEPVSFTDRADIAPYALSAVMAMQKAGIINGSADGGFKPQANATRAEAAKMIAALIKLI